MPRILIIVLAIVSLTLAALVVSQNKESILKPFTKTVTVVEYVDNPAASTSAEVPLTVTPVASVSPTITKSVTKTPFTTVKPTITR